MPLCTGFQYKDRLFKAIFTNKARLLLLYNVLNGSNHTNTDNLEITTIESVIYLGMRNDLSFLIDDEISLYRQQSSYNPNMPLQGLMYFAELYQIYLTKKQTNVYSSRLVKIPTPKFIAFYNGADKEDVPDIMKFKLSDAFIREDILGEFEWTATMLNINKGRNTTLLEKYKELNAYSTFVAYVRKHIAAGQDKDSAIKEAIDNAIKNNLLNDFFKERKMEVLNMSLKEFNQEEYDRIRWGDGRAEGILSTERTMLIDKMDARLVARYTNLSIEEVSNLQATL